MRRTATRGHRERDGVGWVAKGNLLLLGEKMLISQGIDRVFAFVVGSFGPQARPRVREPFV